MNLLKTYILLPSGHGIHIYRRNGARGANKPLALCPSNDYVGIAEAICADMPSLNCDIGLMADRIEAVVTAAIRADQMTYITNRDVQLWHREVPCAY